MDPVPEMPNILLKKCKSPMKSTKTVSEPTNVNVKKKQPKRKRKQNNLTKITSSKHKQMKSIPPMENVTAIQKLLSKGKEVNKTSLLQPKADERYPLLKDEELIKKFQAVPMTNNQKGRIRLVLKDSLVGTSDFHLPNIIHNKIQTILRHNEHLNDTDLRKIRILYNMLKTAVSKNEQKQNQVQVAKDTTEVKNEDKKDQDKDKKVGGTKSKRKVKKHRRYVVFVGNLPLDINTDTIMNHFSELKDSIKDIRIPEASEEKKSSIAYIELHDEPTYELALSKHHSMLGNKRINVLYTAHNKSKITMAKAKSKTAKLIAMQQSGKLIGSTPLKRKRSQRRAKMRKAKSAAENIKKMLL